MAEIVLDFPFLNDPTTVEYIGQANVFFLMRGLPGSGKSTLARAIHEKYPDSKICTSDDFFIQPDGTYQWSREKLKEAHEWNHNNARKACESKINVVIADSTMVQRTEWRFYLDLARKENYTLILASPKTSWNQDPSTLAVKNQHNVPQAAIEEKKRIFDEQYTCPYFWAWFLDKSTTDKLVARARSDYDDIVRSCKDFAEFYKGDDDTTTPVTYDARYVDRNSAPPGNVYNAHCVAFYAGGGRSDKAVAYSQRADVQAAMGRAFELAVTGLIVTPHALAARVSLADDTQRVLLDRFDANIVLATDGETTQPQTIVAEQVALLIKEETSQPGAAAGPGRGKVALEGGGGWVRYYGEGKCLVDYEEPVSVVGLFSGHY